MPAQQKDAPAAEVVAQRALSNAVTAAFFAAPPDAAAMPCAFFTPSRFFIACRRATPLGTARRALRE